MELDAEAQPGKPTKEDVQSHFHHLVIWVKTASSVLALAQALLQIKVCLKTPPLLK